MCAFRGRLQFKQYMPQKPNKYGIKLYMLSEADSGYVWNFSVFCGQSNVVINIVTNLLGSLSGAGRTLYTDRFYTSPELARELEKIGTALVGTVMKNRRGLPREWKNLILQKGEQIFRRSENLLAICWKDKRPVYMLSTRHTAQMITYQTKRGTEKTKPACVLDYNQNKAGVDLTDQLMSYGVFDHKTVKWWKKLTFHCLLMSVVNACILHNKVKGKKMSVTQFMKLLCTELPICEGDSPRQGSSGGQLGRLSTGNHFLEKIPIPPGKKRIQKMCKVCSARVKKESGKAKRKDTSYWCSECKLALCVEPCFKIFHSKNFFSAPL
ncbi:piggyBac transposable element-derived protein 4-like isoform X1 [Ischnura elegans]|uniref:piggyBac transposable element-derived protein 4-like isoform X1 n=1 Tax=Ischnura elegans TaxID=197161 RepID=UPI001ED8A713|nr:piggyBac transposable element-derived protein 4-like isoform X1 [Ischnura elegans]